MNIEQRMLEIKGELKKLRASVSTAKDDELDGIGKKISDLTSEYEKLEKRQKLLQATQDDLMSDDDDINKNSRSVNIIGSFGESKKQKEDRANAQKRASMAENWKKANRTVILDADVLVPEHKSNTIQGLPFNQVSNIIDAVNYLPLIGGESYEEPYVIESGIADYTSQPSADGSGGDYHEVGIGWKSVKINKTKVTAYSEITKELEKTPAANYADVVENNIVVSIKKKLAKEIVVGDGASEHFVGIMSTAADSNTVSDFDLGAINENTLDELILNHGGEEDIESKMAILLNKLTLLAFSRVRGSDKRKVYNINYENGTIDGIKFFTSGSVKPFDTADIGEAVMAYGDFDKYRVAVFSDIETARSEHYKFRQGIIAFRGDAFMGGNIMAYKAFSRVFKSESSITRLTAKTESVSEI